MYLCTSRIYLNIPHGMVIQMPVFIYTIYISTMVLYIVTALLEYLDLFESFICILGGGGFSPLDPPLFISL